MRFDLICIDVMDGLAGMRDESVQCVPTRPLL